LTAVLIVASTDDLAADLVSLGLRRRGAEFVRLDPTEFCEQSVVVWDPNASVSGFSLAAQQVGLGRIRSAWLRDEGGPVAIQKGSPNKEDFAIQEWAAFLSGFWETASWLWINKPSAMRVANLKLKQLETARQHGFKIPRTLVTNSPAEARKFLADQTGIVKSVGSAGYIESGRKFSIFTTAISTEHIDDDDLSFRASPVVLQERIPREYDLRVTIVGSQIFAARIVLPVLSEDMVDWRAVDPALVRYEWISLPLGLSQTCIEYVRRHSLVYAALDFIVTPDGDHVFLELNPSGQWGWLETAEDAPITDAIADCLIRGIA
jgi:glutathione synthase/RimK-type ligase-like ATP-grasp enzyme